MTDETHRPELPLETSTEARERATAADPDAAQAGPEIHDQRREEQSQDPPFQEFILSMKQKVRAAEEDPDSPMRTLESVQDQLIDQLDHLNTRIENYIDLLAAQRKSA